LGSPRSFVLAPRSLGRGEEKEKPVVDFDGPQSGSLEVAVSDAVARLYLDKFGKGPLAAETFISGDVVTTVLRDVYTAAERALIAGGRSDSVLVTRSLWQHATDGAFKQAVEEVLGRTVLSAVSGFGLNDDVATEVFLLAAADTATEPYAA
jgi:uncharacterized protein YbcI